MSSLTQQTIAERLSILEGLGVVDINSDQTGDWHAVDGHERFRAVMITGTVSADNQATLEFEQAEDGSGTNSKSLGSQASETAGTGGEELQVEVEEKATAMDDGFTHIRVKATCDEGATVNAAAVLLMADGRYRP